MRASDSGRVDLGGDGPPSLESPFALLFPLTRFDMFNIARPHLLTASATLGLCASAAGQSCPNPDFLEPNDTCATASTSLVGAGTATATDLNLTPTDEDHFFVPLLPGETATIEMTFLHNMADLDLELYEAGVGGTCGTLLDSSTSISDMELVMYTNTGTSPIDVIGRSYWFSSGIGATCSEYDVTITVDASPCGMDDIYEPNDSCSAPAGLPFGLIEDLHCSDASEDFYQIFLDDGAGLLLRIDFEHDDGDLDLWLYDITSGCPGTVLDSSRSVTDREEIIWANNTGSTVEVVVRVEYFPSDGGCNTYDLTIGDREPFLFYYDVCDANVNSSGNIASIGASGVPVAANNDMRLSVNQLPLNSIGMFVNSTGMGYVSPSNSVGRLCINQGGVGRFNRPGEIQVAAGPPSVDLQLDLTNLARPGGSASVQSGETWYFQYWHRDTVNGMATSNFTGAIAIPFQ